MLYEKISVMDDYAVGGFERMHQEFLILGNQFSRFETEVKQRFAGYDMRFNRLEERMDRLEERMDRLEERMDILEGKLNELLYLVTKIAKSGGHL